MFKSLTFAATLGLSLAITGAHAAQWTVDHAKSSLTFEATQGGAPLPGEFQSWEADIDFDPANLPDAKIRVTIDTGSVTSANAQAAQMLPSEGWFNAGAFPKATFEAQDVIDNGNGAYEAIGTLTIKDMAMPMLLPFQLAIDGATATASGTADVLRGDFAIGKDIPEATVAGSVRVHFEITATK